jgi:hypothetical protein
MTESEMFAILQPCLYGPLTDAAISLILSDRLKEFPRALTLADRVLRAHSLAPRSAIRTDQQARVYNLIRKLVGQGRTRESAIRTARAIISDLDQVGFDAACALKPNSRIRERANEIRGGQGSSPISRLEFNPDLIST